MKKNIKMIWFVSIVLTLLSSITIAISFWGGNRNPSKPSPQIIDQIYGEMSGYSMSEKERKFFEEQKESPTYGEITRQGIEKLRELSSPTNQDVFYDLGSGIGRACMEIAIFWPVKKVVGIELSKTRFELALQAQKKLAQLNYHLPRNKKLIFKQQNILNADLSDATIIYMCSTCYPDALMQTLVEKFARLRPGVKIFSQKPLPSHAGIKFIGSYTIEMSWSKESSINYYQTVGQESKV